MSKETTAIRYHEYGKPSEALTLETLPLPEIGPGDALLKVLAAPINPADLGRIGGTYGDLAPLPAVGGLEGVAEVIALGEQVTSLQIGQRVFVPSEYGSWQTCFVAPAAELFPAPEKLSMEIAAMGWVNPATAWKLMRDFVQLKPGDWIAQNAATSAVGKLVIQFAKSMGVKTINFVRSMDAADSLKALGADIVVLDNKETAKKVFAENGKQKAVLAFNSIGGNSVYNLCKLLEDGSPVVTFGGMDRDLSPFPTRYLIFNDLQLRGLWVSKWYKTAPREEIIETHKEMFSFMESTGTTIDVGARYPLASFAEAIEKSQEAGKPGKVLFVME